MRCQVGRKVNSAASSWEGYTFTPLITSMSSVRPLMRAIRTVVLPQRHGSKSRRVTSPVL
ncbi:MAG: hypothetical protein Q8P98_04960 [Candidatus Rokubacteria bacterium]|nr:hypothetical protein [Candidatus Rokubacteria bacterium]